MVCVQPHLARLQALHTKNMVQTMAVRPLQVPQFEQLADAALLVYRQGSFNHVQSINRG